MAWCEANRVDYVFGLAPSARLEEQDETVVERPARQRKDVGVGADQMRGEIAQDFVHSLIDRAYPEGFAGAAADQRLFGFGRLQREAVLMAFERVRAIGVRRQGGTAHPIGYVAPLTVTNAFDGLTVIATVLKLLT